jgi:hypothetical protein
LILKKFIPKQALKNFDQYDDKSYKMKKLWIAFFVIHGLQAECPSWLSSTSLSQDCQILIPRIQEECNEGIQKSEETKDIFKSILSTFQEGGYCSSGKLLEEAADLFVESLEALESCVSSGVVGVNSCEYFCSQGGCYNQGAAAFVSQTKNVCNKHLNYVREVEIVSRKNAQNLKQFCNPHPISGE